MILQVSLPRGLRVEPPHTVGVSKLFLALLAFKQERSEHSKVSRHKLELYTNLFAMCTGFFIFGYFYRYGDCDRDVAESDVKEAAVNANIDQFVDSLPEVRNLRFSLIRY